MRSSMPLPGRKPSLPMRQSRDSGSRRIVLVDSPEQISLLEFPGITGFCTVDAAGNVSYYKKSTENNLP